jgi:hypothetical protein
MGTAANPKRNRRGRGGESEGLGGLGPQPLLDFFPLSAYWPGIGQAPDCGEGEGGEARSTPVLCGRGRYRPGWLGTYESFACLICLEPIRRVDKSRRRP